MKVSELAKKIGATVYFPENTSDIELTGVDTLENATSSQVSFLSNPSYEKYLATTKAGAVLLNEKKDFGFIQILCKNAYIAFADVAGLFEKKVYPVSGISDKAFIDESAKIGKNVNIYPNVYISKNVTIEADVTLYPGVFIGEGSYIGQGSTLYSNVTVYEYCKIGKYCIFNSSTVIGEGSFGFIPLGDKVKKIPQIGTVEIGNYVETGSNCTIGRAALGVTKVGDYCKLAAFTCVGHNVHLGKCCLVAAYTGFAGSTHVGDRNIYGAGVGVVGHITITDDVVVAAKSNVSRSITKPGMYGGHPILPIEEWRKQHAVVKNIVALKDKVKALEEQVKALLSNN